MTKAVKAKKHLGQHFLKNDEIALKITNLISKTNNQVLEIGPGMGILTKFLIKKNIDVMSFSTFNLDLDVDFARIDPKYLSEILTNINISEYHQRSITWNI